MAQHQNTARRGRKANADFLERMHMLTFRTVSARQCPDKLQCHGEVHASPNQSVLNLLAKVRGGKHDEGQESTNLGLVDVSAPIQKCRHYVLVTLLSSDDQGRGPIALINMAKTAIAWYAKAHAHLEGQQSHSTNLGLIGICTTMQEGRNHGHSTIHDRDDQGREPVTLVVCNVRRQPGMAIESPATSDETQTNS
jgi:hypothetical protein